MIQRFEAVKKLETPKKVTDAEKAAFANQDDQLTFTCLSAASAKAQKANANVVSIGGTLKEAPGVIQDTNLMRFGPNLLAVRSS